MSAHHSSLDPHPEFERLRRAMRRCRPMAGPWSGDLFRCARPEYANGRDLLSGEGARRNGARWTPPGRFEAVYGSLDPETALVEALDHFRRYGFPASQAMPRVFVALAAELALALDLTRGEVRRRLRLSESRMRQEDFPAACRVSKICMQKYLTFPVPGPIITRWERIAEASLTPAAEEARPRVWLWRRSAVASA